MAGKGGRPVSEIYPNDWDKIVEQAGLLGKELDSLLRAFEGGYDPASGPPSEAVPVLDGARELADKLMYADSERPTDPQAQAWQYVPGGDVQALLDAAGYQAAWKSLGQWNAGRSQQLHDLLQKLQGVMSQLVF
jgi:hypothetical protein